ncbi:MAG: PAS domain S-box protein [Candidatus Magasanikbacteria bacterium]|nr:PAS domain S-box protein [Candidatus Magasanikbacteria bacterium]
MKVFSEASSILIFVVGALVLVSWNLKIAILTSIFHNFSLMAPHSALGAMFLGLALWLQQEKRSKRWVRNLGRGCALFVFILGIISFAGYVLGNNFFAGELFFRLVATSNWVVNLGKMSLGGAIVFIFFGLALLFLDFETKRGVRPAQVMAIMGGFISLVALVGYIHNVPSFVQGVAVSPAVPLYTVIVFFIFHLGILFAHPDRGFTRVLVMRSFAGKMSRIFLPTMFIIPPIIGWLVEYGKYIGLYTLGFNVGLETILNIFTLSAVVTAGIGLLKKQEEYKTKVDVDLLRKEGRFHNLVDIMDEGIAVQDEKGIISFINNRGSAVLGYKPEELIGKSATILFDEENQKIYREQMVKRRKGERASYEIVGLRKDGLKINAIVSPTPLFDEKGDFAGSMAVFTDITERKKAEFEREQFFNFFNLSSDIMVIADPNGAFKKVNLACLKILGYSEADLLTKPFIDFVYPEDKQATLDEMARQIKVGSSLNFENRFICKDGRVLWLSWIATYDKDKGITYATARDITKQKQLVLELKNERVISDAIMETFPGTFAMISQRGGTPRWNKNLEIVTGRTSEEISTMSNEQALEWFYTKENRVKIIEAMEKTFREGSAQLEVEHLLNRGRSHAIYFFNAARIELNKELYIVVWGMDISKIKKAEEDIKKEKEKVDLLAKDLEKFKLAVDNESDHVMITDKDGAILYVNKAGEEITGYMSAEVIGKNAGDLWGGNMSKEYYEKLWTVIDDIQKQPFVGEIINHRKNGQPYTAEVRIAPVLDKNNQVQFFVGVERDITKLKEAEQMKTDFISFASHQLRTPLTAIKWNTEMLRDVKSGELTVEQKRYLNEIENGEKRMADLIKSLLNISRLEAQKIKIEPKPTDIASLISSVISEVNSVANARNCAIIFNESDQPASLIDADPVLLKQVILNLLNNAIHYSKSRKCKIEIGFKEVEGHCQIDVKDEGIGIPSKDQDKVFSKFFRADNAVKVSTEGIGLGLYIVKLIIETGGGKVWFESTEGKGSVFHVAIPTSGMKRVVGDKELSI